MVALTSRLVTVSVSRVTCNVFGMLHALTHVLPPSHYPLTNTFFVPWLYQGLIPDTSLEEVRGQELHYLLPLKQAQPAVLATLFRQLEEAKVSLDVSSYGLTSCSLDEVFWFCFVAGLVPRPYMCCIVMR